MSDSILCIHGRQRTICGDCLGATREATDLKVLPTTEKIDIILNVTGYVYKDTLHFQVMFQPNRIRPEKSLLYLYEYLNHIVKKGEEKDGASGDAEKSH